MRFLSVCSGIEAASCALEPLGFVPVGFAEIDKAASRVLAHHYGSNMPGEPLSHNGVPNYGDFTLIDTKSLGRVDWLIGGTPCQSFSIAGKRLSLADARGNLTLSYAVLAHELVRHNGLRGCLWENVPGCLNTADNSFGCFLGALVGNDDALLPEPKPRDGISTDFWRWRKAGRFPVLDDDGIETGEFVTSEARHICSWPDAGMVAGPRARLAWRILDAQHHRLAQRRRRVFVVVGFGNRVDPAAILLESKGVRWNPSKSREKREAVTGTLSARTKGGGGLGTDFECGGGLVAAPDIARCDATREGASQDFESTTMIAVAPPLTSNPYGDHESREGLLVACDLADTLPVGANQTSGYIGDFVAHSLRGSGFDASEDGTGRGTPIVPVKAYRTTGNSGAWDMGDKIDTLSTGTDPSAHVLAFAIQERAVSENPDAGPDGIGVQEGVSYTLEGRSQVQAVAFGISRDAIDRSGEGAAGNAAERSGLGILKEMSPTIKAKGPNAVAFDTTQITHPKDRCNPQLGDPCHPLAASAHPPAVAFDLRGREGGAQFEGPHDTANIRAASGGSSRSYVAQQWAVRRLTPRECERLQGFPDDYTLIPDENGKGQADGSRYRQLGNSFAVPVVRWIGERILASMKEEDHHEV